MTTSGEILFRVQKSLDDSFDIVSSRVRCVRRQVLQELREPPQLVLALAQVQAQEQQVWQRAQVLELALVPGQQVPGLEQA